MNENDKIQRFLMTTATEVIKTSLTPAQIKNRLGKFVDVSTIGNIFCNIRPYNVYVSDYDFKIERFNSLLLMPFLSGRVVTCGKIIQNDLDVLVETNSTSDFNPTIIFSFAAIGFIFSEILYAKKTVNNLCFWLSLLFILFINFIIAKNDVKKSINFIHRVLDEKNELSVDEYRRIIFKENIPGIVISSLILTMLVGVVLCFCYYTSKLR